MLDALRLIVAIGLPWLAATLLLLRWWADDGPGRWAASVGYGYFLAMFAVAVVLLTLEKVLSGWLYHPTLALSGVLVLWGGWSLWRMRRPHVAGGVHRHPLAAGWKAAPTWVRLLVVALCALAMVRLGGLLVETLWRPVYAWDAWYYWTYRARAFFEYGSANAFVQPDAMLRGDEMRYAGSYRHPALVSVIQLWPALALGRWHDSMVNLPWFLAGPALGLAVFGQLRRLRLGILLAVFAAYLVLSVPLLGIHIGWGGYADIWMVGALGLAVLSMLLLMERGRWQELWVFVPLLGILPFIKQAGILFAGSLVAAVLFGALRPLWACCCWRHWGLLGRYGCSARAWTSVYPVWDA